MEEDIRAAGFFKTACVSVRQPLSSGVFAVCLLWGVAVCARAQTFGGDFGQPGGATYNSASNFADVATGIALDLNTAGGPFVYVTGHSSQTVLSCETIKYNASGVAVASATIAQCGNGWGNLASTTDPALIARDPSGNIIVASSRLNATTDAILYKYDANLNWLSSATFSGGYNSEPLAMALDPAGNIYLTGRVNVNIEDVLVLKFSNSFVFLASATFDWSGRADNGNAVAVDGAGNIIVAGGASSASCWQTLMLKYNSSLTLLSSATFNATGTWSNLLNGVATDAAQNYYAVGYVAAASPVQSRLMMKYNSALVLLSTATFIGGGVTQDSGQAIALDSAGNLQTAGMALAATQNWEMERFTPNLVLMSTTVYDSATDDWPYAIAVGSDTRYYVTGTNKLNTLEDYATLRFNSPPAVPNAPSGFSGTAQSTSSIQWSWIDNSNNESGFRVMQIVTNLSGDLAANTTTWLQTGLSANTQQTVMYVQAFNSTGTANSTTSGKYTLALAPSSPTINNASASTIGVSWSTAANPANTQFQIEHSTDNVSFVMLSSGVIAAYTDGGLNANTTYYYRVEAFNGDGVATAYSAAASTIVVQGFGPGCATQATATAGAFSIQSAVNTAPAMLLGNHCVFVNAGTYNEQVTVSGVNANNFRVIITSAAGAAVVVNPPAASTAAFVLTNASVTVQGFTILPSSLVQWGVKATGPAVQISGVNVDSGGKIWGAGIALSSGATVSNSSVTVQVADGLDITGSWNNVSQSTFTTAFINNQGVQIWSGGGNTITQSYILASAGDALGLSNTTGNTVTQSTITTLPGGGAYALRLGEFGPSGSNTFANDYIGESIGTAVTICIGCNNNAINQSTVTTNNGGGQAAVLVAGANNTFANDILANPAGWGLYFVSGAWGNSASGLSITASTAVYSTRSSNWSVTGSVLTGGASGAVVSLDTQNGGVLTLSNDTLSGSPFGVVVVSSMGATLSVSTLTFQGLTAGATAFSFLGGPYVSTISFVNFADATVGTNVDGHLLGGAARLTMLCASGPRSGAAFEDDPASQVDWTGCPPAAPGGFAGAAQSTGAIQWTWVDNSSNELGFRVMQGAANLSGDLAVNTTAWLQTGLSTNALQANLFVQAFNASGTSNSATASKYTLALAPAAPAIASATVSSVGVLWSTATNPAGTQFQLEHSTQGGSFVLVSSGVIAAAADGGLNANTSYFYRLEAFNGDGIATAYSPTTSTTTPAGIPPFAPTGFSGVAQSPSSIKWTWNDNSVDETGFRVMQGAANLSGNLPVNTTSWLQTGLSTNTQQTALFVQVFNSTGTTNSATASAYSGALPPPAPTFANITASSIGVSWSTTTNIAGTPFQVERSTQGGVFVFLSSGVVASYVDTGLNSNTSYYYRVTAFNVDGVATAYSPTASAVTLPSLVAAPSGFAGAALTASSIRWTWTDNANNEAGYRVMSGLTNLSGDLPANTTVWVQTGLSTNTASGPLAAQAFNGTGNANSAAATVYTLASPPSGTALSAFTATTATATWSRNQSPASTVDEVQRSTDNASYLTSFLGVATSLYETNLLGCTTYYYRVRQKNGDGLLTAFDVAAQFQTRASTPAPAGGLTAQAVGGNKIQLNWAPSPTEGITGYRLFYDNGGGTINYGAALAVLTSTETSFTTQVLTSSAVYSFALRADHRCGVEETTGAFAAAASTGALSGVRAAIKSPQSGKHVNGNSVTVIAELIAGTPSQTQQITFQYRASGTTPWLPIPAANLNHPNPDPDFPYFIQWDVTGLAGGGYDLRAVALDVAGSSDTAPGVITLVVDAVNPTHVENLVGLQTQTLETVDNAVTSKIAAAGTGNNDPSVNIILPAGALSVSTAVVTLLPNPIVATSPPAGFSTVGSAIQIDLSNGQHQLSNGLTANITMTYPPNVADANDLKIYSLDPVTGNWTRDFDSVVNVASRTISGNTPHFSVFVILQGGDAKTSLDNVRIYPNPYKPNGGNANEGRPFAAGDPGSGIIFDNLTNDVKIEIYSLSGRKVAEFTTLGSNGKVHWDVRNMDGRDVASGGYFAVIKSGGIKPKVKKFAIIR